MIKHLINNISSVLFGVVFAIVGVVIFINGNIWNVRLGDEKYLVGSFVAAVGLYILFIVIKNKDD